MKYYKLEPEVAGQIGNKSKVVYEKGKIKEVIFLEYVFYGWQGDELLTTTPCFIIANSLKNDIIINNLIGFTLQKIKISFSREYFEYGGNIFIPKFLRLLPNESYEENKENLIYDFYYDRYRNLIVSENALAIIKKHKINYCDIEEMK